MAIKGFIIALCSLIVSVRCSHKCFSREDTYLCKYNNSVHYRAQPNHYSVHVTRFNRRKECKVKKWGQYVAPIPNLRTDEMKILYSPGFEYREPYLPQLKVEYKVQCKPDELAFYNITFLDLPEKNCTMEGSEYKSCRNYVEIQRDGFGKIEECGSIPSKSSVLQVENRIFTVVFRTSRKKNTNHTGFQMYVTCFKPSERSRRSTQESGLGCVKASEFTSGVCATGQSNTNKEKKCACHAHHKYKKYIPNKAEQMELVSMTQPLLTYASKESTNYEFFNETDTLSDECPFNESMRLNSYMACSIKTAEC